MNKSDANRILNDIRGEQQENVALWQQLAKLIDPTRGCFYGKDNKLKRIDYRARLDSTASYALEVLAAGMVSGLTSPSKRWFKLGVARGGLNSRPDVAHWLDGIDELMSLVFAKSNIYQALHSFYKEIGAFGTAAFLYEPDYNNVVKATSFTVGEYYLGLGANGIDTFGRDFYLNTRSLVQQFGLENVPSAVQQQYKAGNYYTWHQVHHLITPNDKADPTRLGADAMPWTSLYWMEGQNDDFLRVGGFKRFPVRAARWSVPTSFSVWGNGPGQLSLGDVKMLQKLQKSKFLGLEKNFNPPLMAPASIPGEINVEPGGVNRYNGSTLPSVKELYQVKVDLNSIEYAIEQTKKDIKTAFFADLFLMLEQITGRMTATEVVERNSEKLLMLGPVLERLKNELLDPLIADTFAMMWDAGLIPQPPEILQGEELKVEYISILATAQKQSATDTLDKLFTFAATAAKVAPSVADNVNFDRFVQKYFRKSDEADLLNSEQDVARVRAQAAAAQAQQQQLARAQAMLAAAKTASETKLGQNSALDVLAQAGGIEQQ